jgi:hypothetical protein
VWLDSQLTPLLPQPLFTLSIPPVRRFSAEKYHAILPQSGQVTIFSSITSLLLFILNEAAEEGTRERHTDRDGDFTSLYERTRRLDDITITEPPFAAEETELVVATLFTGSNRVPVGQLGPPIRADGAELLRMQAELMGTLVLSSFLRLSVKRLSIPHSR